MVRVWQGLQALATRGRTRALAEMVRWRQLRARPSVIRDRVRIAVIDRRRRRLSLVPLALVVAAVVAGVIILVLPGSSEPWITVNGRRVGLPRPATVDGALRTAHLSLRAGQMYSVVTHRLLTAQAGELRLLVDGHPATGATTVRAGDHLQVDGSSGVEPVTTRYVFSTSPGLPDIERALWHPGRSALELDMVGSVSGEVKSRSIAGPPVVGQAEANKVVALTFDDGPDPNWTPAVLRILAEERVPATFCVVGIHVRTHPELVRAELAQHETLCDHTLDHDVHLDRASPARIAYEVNAGADAIAGAAGVQSSFYRPPGGTLSKSVIEIAHQRGLRVLYWTVDSEDYLRPAPGVLLQRILAGVRPGAIILMHDGGGDRSHTVAILRPLIDTLRAQGYSFTTPAAEQPVATPPVQEPAGPAPSGPSTLTGARSPGST
jgi:peptidoglycan/xylan/chitin deacetylase (PgdA/CDA1 family)